MALIKCPECGKDVSNKATACIHCGYPLDDIMLENICVVDGVPHDLTDIKKKLLNTDLENKEEEKKLVRELGSLIGTISLRASYELAQIIVSTGNVPATYDGSHLTVRSKKDDGKIHCPKCDSTNIVTGQRGYSIITGFWGSNRTMNRCAKCGYKWEPRR